MPLCWGAVDSHDPHVIDCVPSKGVRSVDKATGKGVVVSTAPGGALCARIWAASIFVSVPSWKGGAEAVHVEEAFRTTNCICIGWRLSEISRDALDNFAESHFATEDPACCTWEVGEKEKITLEKQ